MFDSKRIKELETKVDLILDHLGLEYMPRLVEKDIPKYTDYINSAKQTMDIKVDDLVAVKNEEISEKIPKGRKERICQMCGEKMIVKKSSGRKYCDECLGNRKRKQQLKWARKNRKRYNI